MKKKKNSFGNDEGGGYFILRFYDEQWANIKRMRKLEKEFQLQIVT